MRRAICTMLYKMGLRRLAYKVSPSVCGFLYGVELRATVKAGLQYAAGFAAALKGDGEGDG